ncbi:ABC transporter substrate-binding protein [Bradyrhizobium guangdongense]|nr:ABC transporter substrate-binding protein [Bradyrhizobium guangdongense]
MRSASKAVIAIVLACQWAAAGGGKAAGPYPERAIRLVVGFPAGGSSDAIARIVQPDVEKQLGQTLIIENRPGAGGALAMGMVAKAPPDGYMIGLGGAAGLGVSLGVQETMTYDARKDLAPITGLASVPFILAASNSLQGKTLRDIIAMAKQPNKLALGHGGNGTLMHLASEMFNQMADTRLELVPYRGMAPVVTDLIGGHMPLGIVDPPSAKTAIEGGLIAPIAVTSARRYPGFPNTPTFAEQGLAGFEAIGWFGIVAPAGTPGDVVAKLNAAFVTALSDPAIAERIRGLGSDPMPMAPDEFSRFIESEAKKWEAVAAKAGKK